MTIHMTCVEWDELVTNTYGKPYVFQQQYGCQDRGVYHLTVPSSPNDFENHSLPETLNGQVQGVSFQAWLARDPEQLIPTAFPEDESWETILWWERNFYPDINTVANDLHKRGVLAAGDYLIHIDW